MCLLSVGAIANPADGANAVTQLAAGEGWSFEPKYDGRRPVVEDAPSALNRAIVDSSLAH
jgi:hypothetical protein